MGPPHGWVHIPGPTLPHEAPRPPLVLVHGLGGSAGSWGAGGEAAAGAGGPLIETLLGHGYELDRNLFVLDYSHRADDDFMVIAQEELVPLLEAVYQESAAASVDLVGNSMGGLVARAAAAMTGVPVRHLITIGTPHRGAQLAHLGRLQAELERQWQRHARGWQAVDDPAGSGNLADAVTVRARDGYLPLFHAFLGDLLTAGPGQGPLSFLGWLARHAPGAHRRLLASDPLQPPTMSPPAEAASLAEGYVELLALRSALHVGTGGRPLAVSRPGEGDTAARWLERTPLWFRSLHRLAASLMRFVRELSRSGETAGWQELTQLGLGVDLLGPGVMRLIPYQVPAADPAGLQVPANRFLAAWNRQEEEARRQRGGPLLTSFAGHVAHPGTLVFPVREPSDLVVETRSADLAPGPLDWSVAVRGGRSGEHFRMLAERQVVDLIIRRLQAAFPVAELQRLAPGAAPSKGTLSVPAGRLAAVAARDAAPTAGAWHGTLQWQIKEPLQVHLYARPAAMEQGPAETWAYWQLTDGGELGLDDHTSWRLEAGAWDAVVIAARHHQGLGRVQLDYELGHRQALPAPAAVAPAHVPEPGGQGHGPLIDAIYRSRMTTTKRERIEEHQRWLWSFGDGQTMTVDDPQEVESTVHHRFAAPGEYDVTARSLTAFGRTIVSHRWQVRVTGPADALHTFRARSVPSPLVRLDLQGPASWPVHRPAQFHVELDVQHQPEVTQVQVWHHPDPRFQVRWARPGRFNVRAAVTLRITADLGGRTGVLWQTHVIEKPVEVVATTVVD